MARGTELTIQVDLLAKILHNLDLEEQLQLSTVSHAWCEAVRINVRGVAVDLRAKSRHINSRLLEGSSIATLALTTASSCGTGTAAAAASQAACWELDEHKLWQQAPAASRVRPAAAAWHLRRAAAALTGRGRSRPGQRPASRSLTLLLAAPEMDTDTSQLHRMLVTAGAEGLFASVCMPQGLLRLDGCLAHQLVCCNSPASCLLTALQAPICYARLERLALKLSPSDDLPSILGCINTKTLPALRCLALLAPASAGVAADLASMHHPALTRLHLQGVQLPTGFSSLQQLSGLQELAVKYDEEDEAPPLNLTPADLSALSSLNQLSALSLDCLASGEGLPALTQLTSLSLSPQQGARITVKGLPLLRRLAVDLSAGSCGNDLLSANRSSVHVPVAGHGLSSLQHLELRCFIWRHWEAAAASSASAASASSASSASMGSGASSSSASEHDSEDEEEDEEEEEDNHGGSSVAGSDSEQQGVGSDASSSSGGSSSGSSEASQSVAGSEVSWGEADELSGSEGPGSVLDAMEAEEEGEEEAQPLGVVVGGAGVALAMGNQGEGDGAADAQQQAVQEEGAEPQAGLLDASWGFVLQHQQQQQAQQAQQGQGGSSSGRQHAHAMASLEQSYLAALLARLPTLNSIQLTDYMGLMDPPILLAAVNTAQAGKQASGGGGGAPGPAPGAGGKEAGAVGGGGGGGSRAGSPSPLQHPAGAVAADTDSCLAGWRRLVAETPVPGGISQYDLTYTHTCTK